MYMHILVHYGNLYCLFFKFVKFKINKNELRMQVLVFVRNNPCLWNVKNIQTGILSNLYTKSFAREMLLKVSNCFNYK